jgi:hypothetical protein
MTVPPFSTLGVVFAAVGTVMQTVSRTALAAIKAPALSLLGNRVMTFMISS